jgi:hypothetical protein
MLQFVEFTMYMLSDSCTFNRCFASAVSSLLMRRPFLRQIFLEYCIGYIHTRYERAYYKRPSSVPLPAQLPTQCGRFLVLHSPHILDARSRWLLLAFKCLLARGDEDFTTPNRPSSTRSC